MKNIKSNSGITGTKKMSDRELTERLSRLQRSSAVCTVVGLIGIAGGIISFFAASGPVLKAALTGILFFGGICCVIFLAGGAQKKAKALIHEQLGDFFRAELEAAFGPNMPTPEMKIDETCLEKFYLPGRVWEELESDGFHEGSCRGLHFSAANVRLIHVYERGNIRDGRETCRDKVFGGIVIRCKAHASPRSPIRVNARTANSPRGIITGNEAFDRIFCVIGEPEPDVLGFLSPEFTGALIKLGQSHSGKLLCAYWKNNIFSLAIETNHVFADDGIAGDAETVRRRYVSSLREMEHMLDILREIPALSGTME